MTSVGEILRTGREAQGRQVAEIAQELCIMQSYLLAIEQDDLGSLPGIFFYKSFARQYAATLGLDIKEIQLGIDTLTASAEPLPLPGADPRYAMRPREVSKDDRLLNLVAEGPALKGLDPLVEDGNRRYRPDRRFGLSLAALFAMLLGCSGFYAWWNKAPQPVSSQALSQPAPSPAASLMVDNVKNPQPDPPSAPTVDVTTTTGADGLKHVVLSLSATEETWLSVTSEGKQIFSGILQPSQTKTLTGLEVAKMKVGNAGGLEVQWNGKAIGPIGPRGQVRVVLFTPENVQILGPAQAPSPSPSQTL